MVIDLNWRTTSRVSDKVGILIGKIYKLLKHEDGFLALWMKYYVTTAR